MVVDVLEVELVHSRDNRGVVYASPAGVVVSHCL